MSELIQCERHEAGLSSLVLQRPERRNALSIALLDGLCALLTELSRESAQRVVILRGAGPVFCAGLDLREAADEALLERSASAVERALHVVRSSPLVTIAAVHGGAFAGGAGLMAACDIVIAAEDAQFSFPEARRGLLPALIGEVLRTRVREGDLRDLLLTGDVITAARAQQVGLVQRVVPAASLLQEAVQVGRSVLAGAPEAIRLTKQLIAQLYASNDDASSRSMAEWHLAARHGAEAREGLAAFLERRPPAWQPGDSS